MVKNLLTKKAITQMLTLWAVLLLQVFFFSANASLVDSKALSFVHTGDGVTRWNDDGRTDNQTIGLTTTAANQYFVIYVSGGYNINLDKVYWSGGEKNVNSAVASDNINWKDGTAVAGMDFTGNKYLVYQISDANVSDFKIQFRSWNSKPATATADFQFYIVESINDMKNQTAITGNRAVVAGGSSTLKAEFQGFKLPAGPYTWKWETSDDNKNWTVVTGSTTDTYTTKTLNDGEKVYVRASIQGINPETYGLTETNLRATALVASSPYTCLVKVAGPYYIKNYWTGNENHPQEYLVDNGDEFLRGAKNPTLGTEHQWELWQGTNDDNSEYYYFKNVSTGNFIDVMKNFGGTGAFHSDGRNADFDRMSLSAFNCTNESKYRFKLSALPYDNCGAIEQNKVMISEYGNSTYLNRPLTDTWDGKQDEYTGNDPVYIYSTNDGNGDIRYWNFVPVNASTYLKMSSNKKFIVPGDTVKITTTGASADITYYYSEDDGTSWNKITSMTALAKISGTNNSNLDFVIYKPTLFRAEDGTNETCNDFLVKSAPADACNGKLVALFYEPFNLSNTSGDLSCYQQSYEGMSYTYAEGGCITNGKYAVVNNPGHGCHGKDGCLGGSNPERTWFILDYDHTGNTDGTRNVGGMLAVNFNSGNSGDILNKQYELPVGAKLLVSFYVAPMTRETGTDAASLTVYIEESDDKSNWTEVVAAQHDVWMTHLSYLDWQEIRTSITTTKKYARIRIHGNNSGDNGSDIVFDDITIMACQPELDWKLENKPLTDDEQNIMISCNKEQWKQAFVEGEPWVYTTTIKNITDSSQKEAYVKAYFITGTADDYTPGVHPFENDYDKANSTYKGMPLIYLGNGNDCNGQSSINVPLTLGKNVFDADGAAITSDLFKQKNVYEIVNYLFPNQTVADAVKAGADQKTQIFAKSVPQLYTPPLVVITNVCELTTNDYTNNSKGDLVKNFNETWSVAGYEKVEVYNYGDIEDDDLVPKAGKKPLATITSSGFVADSTFYMDSASGNILYTKQYQLLHYKKNGENVLMPYEKTLYRLNIVDMPEIQTKSGSDWKIETTDVDACLTKTKVTGGGTFTAHYSVKDGGTLEYNWTATRNGANFDISGATKSGSSLTVNNLTSGSYVFTMNVKNTRVDTCKCEITEVKEIVIFPAPDSIAPSATIPSLTGQDGVYCIPDNTQSYTVNLSATATTESTLPEDFDWQYVWSVGSTPTGATASITDETLRTANNTATVKGAGTYTFKVQVYGKAGNETNTSCYAEEIVSVVLHETPKAKASEAFTFDNLCVDKTSQNVKVKITAPEMNDLTEDGAFLYYEWNVAGETQSGKDLKVFNATNALTAGNYTSTLNVYSAKEVSGSIVKSECFATINENFTIYAVPSSLTPSATPTTTCLESGTTTIQLDVDVAGTLGTGQAWEYAWTCTEGTGASFDDATKKNPIVTVGVGTYKFKVAVKAAGSSCTAEENETSSLTIYAKPTVSISADKTVLTCDPTAQTATLNATATNAVYYLWSNNEEGASKTSIDVSAAGNYSVTVYSDNAKTCSTSSNVVTITESKNAGIVSINPTSATINCTNGNEATGVDITATVTNIPDGVAITSYEWKKNGATAATHTSSSTTDAYNAAKATTNTTDNYTVVVTFDNGCTASPATVAAVETNFATPAKQTITSKESATSTDTQVTEYCAKDADGNTNQGLLLGLLSSETGVNYQLYSATSPTASKTIVGSPVAGTGVAISFGAYGSDRDTKYYFVEATNAVGCTEWMEFTSKESVTTDYSWVIKNSNPEISVVSFVDIKCATGQGATAVAEKANITVKDANGLAWKSLIGNPTIGTPSETSGEYTFSNISQTGQIILTATSNDGCVGKDTFSISNIAPITIQAAVEYNKKQATDNFIYHNESCFESNDAYISISKDAVTGGTITSDYTYQWKDENNNPLNATTDLVPGKYFLTVTDDNACFVNDTITITEPTEVQKPTLKTSGTDFTIETDGQTSWYQMCAVNGGAKALNDFIADDKGADSLVWYTETAGVYNEYTQPTIDLSNAETYNLAVRARKANNYQGYCYSDSVYMTLKVIVCTDLALEVTADKDAICQGDTVTYSVKVTNNATVSATNLKVNAEISQSLSSLTSGSLDFGTLAASESSTLQIKAVGISANSNAVSSFYVSSVNDKTYQNYDEALADGLAKTKSTMVNPTPGKLGVREAGLINLKYCVGADAVKLDTIKTNPNDGTLSLQWTTEISATGEPENWSAIVPVISTNQPTAENGDTIYVRQISDKGCIGLPENFNYIVNANPTIAIDSIAQIKCALGQGVDKGAINVTVTDGTPQYTYEWIGSNQFTSAAEDIADLEPGYYQLSVTDANNCKSQSDRLNINARPDSLKIIATDFTPLVCGGMSDGKIVTAVSGGTPAYSYSWTKDQAQISTEPNLFNLGGGDYMLTVVDNNSCTANESFVIDQPEKIVIKEAVHIDVKCFGETGTVALSIEGGEPDYTYQWSNGGTSSLAENLTKGDYTVTVTDAYNCKADTTITIEGPDADLTATLISKTNVSCYGESTGAAEVNVQGGTPDYTYEWSNGAVTKNLSNAAAGYYELTVTDANGCQKLLPIRIETPEEISIGVYNGKMLICKTANDGYIASAVYGGVPPYNYEWSTGSTESGIKDLVVGTYTLKITDFNGCVKSHDYEIEGQEPMADLQISLESNDEDNRILPGDEVTFTAKAVHDQRIDEVYYNWNYNGWTAGQDTYKESIYKDKVIDLWVSDGVCPDQEIKLPVQVIWPTIFTPYDNNGVNDEFLSPKAEGKAHRANWYIIVFNRYGQKVYEGNCGWDGTYKGKTADPGAYYYTVKFPNGESHDGTVEVSKQD